MGTSSQLRQRRSEAELYAALQVERQVRAADPHSEHEYIRAFSQAFRTYRSRLSRSGLLDELLRADVLLVADYHALPASQHYTAGLLDQLSSAGSRPLALAMEAVYARDQHILNAWRNGRIDERTLRSGIRFDADWGFDWDPFFCVLTSARRLGVRLYGIEDAPRGGFHCIARRDRYAAERVASIACAMPGSQIVVLFGESHMAPPHLPAEVRRKLPRARIVTLLQNIDCLYWQAEEEPGARVRAVRVSDDVFCVFNATPLEKYESYRRCLERWS
jgi:hypothetical protein